MSAGPAGSVLIVLLGHIYDGGTQGCFQCPSHAALQLSLTHFTEELGRSLGISYRSLQNSIKL